MVFNLWTRHINSPNKETFFWYFKDDWFTKRKYIWRIVKQKFLIHFDIIEILIIIYCCYNTVYYANNFDCYEK